MCLLHPGLPLPAVVMLVVAMVMVVPSFAD